MTVFYNQFGVNGRLGNQMFQYAFMLGRAKAFETIAQLPKRESENSYESTNDICKFSLASNDVVLGPFHINYDEPAMNFNESRFSFDPNVMHVDKTKNAFYHGYFQSEKYFKEHREDLLKCFSILEPSSQFYEYKVLIERTDSVSVHLRFGDYVGQSNYHTNLSQTMYYYNALQAIQKLEKKQVFVFSDETEKAKEWFQNYMEEITDVVYVDGPLSSAENLILQSGCKTNIIANSSFSWWAAWLNVNQNKTVYAPRQWFGPDGPKDTQDVYCNEWIIIQ